MPGPRQPTLQVKHTSSISNGNGKNPEKQEAMFEILSGVGLACVAWGVAAALLIARDLERRGLSVNYIWLRLFIIKYLDQYARTTREETGRIGPLFYHYIVPLNVALILFIVLAVIGWS